MRGDGSLYLRGDVWWFTYWRDKKKHHESLHTTDERKARARAKRIRDGLISGRLAVPDQRRVTVGQILDDLLLDLDLRSAASLGTVRSHMKPLRAVFGNRLAMKLDTAEIQRFQKERLEAGRKPATVNRACESLRQAYRLAMRRTPPRITKAPYIPMLGVQNARQGFVAPADFASILARIKDEDLRDFLEWFWWTGMRPKEIRSLTWVMLDQATWTMNLDPKEDKTRKGRVIAVVGPLRKVIDRRLAKRRLDTTLVFHRRAPATQRRGGSPKKPGQPIRSFIGAWRQALKKAGFPASLLPYDLRRSALRNLIRGGTNQKVAMQISGHRTAATFDRYNIVDTEDVRAAIERTAAYVDALPKERKLVGFEGTEKLGKP